MSADVMGGQCTTLPQGVVLYAPSSSARGTTAPACTTNMHQSGCLFISIR